jgi:uroporphyrinogen decarboxylase
MNSKNRVIAALELREPDRVPTGEFATDHSVIGEVLGKKTFWRAKRSYYEALWDGRRDEVVDTMKRDIVEFTLAMGLDMVPVNAVPHEDFPFRRPKQLDEDTWEDESGNILKYSRQTEDIGLHRRGDRPAPDSDFQLPDQFHESELELVRYVIEKLGKTHFVFCRPGRFSGLGYTTGWSENQFLRVAEDPDAVAAEQLKGAEGLRGSLEHFVDLGVDGVAIGADYGYNSGPFVSPAAFARIYAPAMKRMCEIVHEFGLPCLFHSCGNNRLILDQMVDAGMDAYQAIQPVERIEEIKELYGDRLSLWGGVSTDTLRRGTPDEVRQQVLFTLKHCAPGGGLILSSSHSVVVGTPAANYRALVEVVRSRGAYPIGIPEEIPEPQWSDA